MSFVSLVPPLVIRTQNISTHIQIVNSTACNVDKSIQIMTNQHAANGIRIYGAVIPSGLYWGYASTWRHPMALQGHSSSTCWADFWSAAEVLSRTGNACSSFGQDAFQWKTNVSLFGFEVWWTFRSVKGYTFPKACGQSWGSSLPQFTIIYPCFTVHFSVKTDYPTKSSAEFQNKCGTVWDMQILSIFIRTS